MVLAVGVVDVAVNPNNTAQRYVYWNNGRIDALGGAVPVTNQVTWYARFEPPGVAIHVTDWVTGSGYTLNYRGGFDPFGSAPAIGVVNTSDPLKGGVPEVAGIPVTAAPNVRRYIDWAWDTSGNGQGYVLDHYGQLLPFGGASAPSFTGKRWTWPAGRKLVMQFTPTKRAVIMDLYGGLHGDFGSTFTVIGPYWSKFDAARDLVVTGYNPVTGYKLDLYGRIYGINLADPSGYPYRKGADVARKLSLLSASNPLQFWEAWVQGQSYDVISSTPPTVLAGGGTNEIQTVTITGTPTAGTFRLTFNGQQTATINWNATAATVQTALRALSNIGSTGVTVTGGPGPGTPYVVEFTGTLASANVAQMTATHTFTGGVSPAISVATTAEGTDASPAATVTTTTRPTLGWNYTDAQGDQQSEWRLLAFTQAFVDSHTMTDPLKWAASALIDLSGVDREQRGVKAAYDFSNGSYRFYVRAKDTAGQWSAWSNRGWTQNITPPAAPTGLTATSAAGSWKTDLSVNAVVGGGLADLIQFQFSTDGTTWYPVRGAEAVPLVATTTATDLDPPLGQAVVYRALAYAADPRIVSNPSNTATATALPMRHVLTSTADPALGGEVIVNDAPSWERDMAAGVFQPAGDPYSVVVSEKTPKARQFPLVIGLNSQAEWDAFENLITRNAALGGTLVFRDPFGEVIYCKPTGGWRRAQKRRLPYPEETTPLGHKHQTTLNLIEIRPPYLISNPTTEAPS